MNHAMERRKFISAGIAASAVPLGCVSAKQLVENPTEPTKELYELRDYDLKWGVNRQPLVSYLKDALGPAMKRAGANHFMVFDEINKTSQSKLRVLISYPGMESYLASQDLSADAAYQAASSVYHAIPVDSPIYNRYSSSLLHAFDGLKQMLSPVEGATVFELRIYEGYSEDAVRRKIKMFNDEEFPLFHKVGLNPVFFGEMISGPLRPCLVYMLNFTDMDAHASAWQDFIKSPEWNEMKVKPIYANTVSNIRNVFLKQI